MNLLARDAVSYTAASGTLSTTWLLLVLPLVGAIMLLLVGKRGDRWAHYLGCATVGINFVLAIVYFFALRGMANREVTHTLFSWIPVSGFQVDAGILYDPLSSVFVLLITGVGFLIHVYSVGYMAHDPDRRRFFAYLNLFVAAMLLLVLGNSYLALYVGWEGVGVASYLLIAFWYWRPIAATAAKKAFIMNRVGDVGLTIAIFVMFATTGTTSYAGVFGDIGRVSSGTVTFMALLLLLGACGKSGQFPLQAWLPDAMEGPTPVSALIHAATMVTAGVYLIARSNAIFDLSHAAQTVVCAIGAVTLLIGCIVGCAKDDIKRVLAYSTVSQIGYMFLAVGLGGEAYALGILHLLTHGFFKATMFLGAGSVMHGMDDQTDMRRFGALRKFMPITMATFLAGYLAIIGFPFFSGYFSKDPIIEAAFNRPGWTGLVFGLAALLGAGLTAFYMTRLICLTFFGEQRWTDGQHPHESAATMTGPMILLGVGAILVGFLLTRGAGLVNWLEPVVGSGAQAERFPALSMTIASLVVIAIGAGLAVALFGRGEQPLYEPVAGPVVRAARANLYADAFNEAVLMRPGQWLARMLVFFEGRGIDGAVNGVAAAFGGSSGRLRRTQTGFVRTYALTMLGGSVLLIAALLAVSLS